MTDSLAGIPGITPTYRSFVAAVRLFIRDNAELNRLVAGEESTERQIAWSVADAISDFNGTPHFTNMSLDDILSRNLHHLLVRMTVCSLVEQVGLLQTRNHVNYSTGGISVGVNDKTPLLMQWLQYFKSYTDQRKQHVKIALNIEGILGPSNSGVHSEYFLVNQSYSRY